nr:RNA-directed DNA polymerase, eukaryota, reverse transcriptase zinc-binding domain protein [Tanacetum cinerariifolium]
MDLPKKLNDIHSAEARDRFQKAKIQWAIEGDENSKFFHGIINRKRTNLAVKGVMVDGEWLDEPCHVKEELRLHFANRFSAHSPNRCKLNFVFSNKLSPDLASDLERPITRAEVRSAVWGCGENKSLGPDGFTFEFFRKYWDILGVDFCAAIDWFFEHCTFARGCNSSFITLIPKTQDPKFISDFRPISLIGSRYKVVTKILANRLSLVIFDLISDVKTAFLPNRQILDGPFIINELLSWCKYKKQQAMVFKVDFAKAYDSVRLDFLDDVLDAFGSGSKWRMWISGSLYSGMALVILNGSPSLEFEFHRGLKQGDPLAPYLFILIMESFHLSISRAVDAGIFRGINISDDLNISHLFYADDAVFIGEWNESNLSDITQILRWVMVGDNTSKVHAWDDTISKVKSRLCNRKSKTLSVGGIRFGTPSSKKFLCSKTKNEIWIAGTPFRDLFPHIYALETFKGCSVASKLLNPITLSLRREVRGGVESDQLALLEEIIGTTILYNMEDMWTWDLNSDIVFRVKDVPYLLDDHFLPKVATATRWVKFVPIKINVFAWKLYLDRLPTRSNLLLRGLESVEARLVVYKQNESFLEENIKLLKEEPQARDNVLVTFRQKLNQAEQERDDLKLKLDKFQSSCKNLTELLASQTNDKHGLGYFSSESDSESLSPSSLSDRIQPSGGYHDVPPPITGTFVPPKPDLVFHTAPIAVETDNSAFTIQLSPSKPAQDLSHTTRPLAPIIEDWVSDSKDESEPNDSQSVPSFVRSSKQVKTPRHSIQLVKEPILDATPKPASLKSNSSNKRKNRKTCFVCRSVDHLIKDYDYHDKKMAQPTPRNYALRVLTQSKPVSITAVRPVSATVPKIMVTRPRHAHSIVKKSKSPIRRHITCSPSPKTSNSPLRVTAAQAPVVSAVKGKEGK